MIWLRLSYHGCVLYFYIFDVYVLSSMQRTKEVVEEQFHWPHFTLKSGMQHVVPKLDREPGPWGWRKLTSAERQLQLDALGRAMNYGAARDVGDIQRHLTLARDRLTDLTRALEASVMQALHYVCIDVCSQTPTVALRKGDKSKLVGRLVDWVRNPTTYRFC